MLIRSPALNACVSVVSLQFEAPAPIVQVTAVATCVPATPAVTGVLMIVNTSVVEAGTVPPTSETLRFCITPAVGTIELPVVAPVAGVTAP